MAKSNESPPAASVAEAQDPAATETRLTAEIAKLRGEVAALSAKVGALSEESAKNRRGAQELRETLARFAQALNRPDLVHPTATAEEVKAALAKGVSLKVLRDFQTIGLKYKAGRVLEANQIQQATILDAVASGALVVSILKAA